MDTTTLSLTPQSGDVTLTSTWLEEAKETAEDDTYTRKHRDPRTVWNAHLEVRVTIKGCTETLYATATDISKGGIGFTLRKPLRCGATIHICRSGEMIAAAATTRKCTRSITGYVIGAEFCFEQKSSTRKQLAKTG